METEHKFKTSINTQYITSFFKCVFVGPNSIVCIATGA
jgi:hypothetical protein